MFLLLVSASLSWAAPHLDRPYRNLVHPNFDADVMAEDSPNRPPTQNDVHRLIERQTPVKDQEERGTCSIFSSTALLESALVLEGKANTSLNLSEEWLQYLTTLRISEEGSTSPDNFRLLRKYGQPGEASMPYVGATWTSKSQGLAAKRCGHLRRGRALKSCLISHRDPRLMKMSDAELLNPISHLYDPEFVAARAEALLYRGAFLGEKSKGDGIIRKVSEIHQVLARGIPLTLDLEFYNGAWNWPGAKDFGIYVNEKLWEQGIVTHPEKGSKDLEYSKTHEEGHSIVVVGYDDNREVEYSMTMLDGSLKKFKRKGVYYFKNSWGASTWGKDFEIDGIPYPGYGMILQVHAHAHGQFYKLQLN